MKSTNKVIDTQNGGSTTKTSQQEKMQHSNGSKLGETKIIRVWRKQGKGKSDC